MLTKYRKKRRAVSRHPQISWVLVGGITVFIISFLVFSNIKIQEQRAEVKIRLQEAEQKIDDLEQENQELADKSSLGEDEDFLEKEARERFNLKKLGEEVVVILPLEGEEDKEKQETIWWNPLTW